MSNRDGPWCSLNPGQSNRYRRLCICRHIGTLATRESPLRPAINRSFSCPRFFRSPLHKLFRAFPDIRDVEIIDPAPRLPDSFPLFSTTIDVSRERAIQNASRQTPAGALQIFSDGSGEHGKVGAAAVVVLPCGDLIVRRAHLGVLSHHTVFESELFGIYLALQIILDTPKPSPPSYPWITSQQSPVLAARLPDPARPSRGP
ncbi:hypothetical protein BKA62DRAFT_511031 [Auriculariales sp. MPI-PUGE-AT-0066]|nr:hypothetical protein BKA62DRAFT_511031 [Auriculariales sp. MPI-PUGE-AT-0066]